MPDRNGTRSHHEDHPRWGRVIGALAIMLALQVFSLCGAPSAPALYASAEHLGSSRTQGTTSITVMSFNLGNGLVVAEDLVEYIRDVDADLVALLEVTPDTAEILETQLSDLFPYQEVRGLGIPGKALLSRYPIADAQWLELNPGRPDLLATVELGARPVDVLVAHPPPPDLNGVIVRPPEEGIEQFDRIVEIADEAENPFLLLGDLNVTSVHQRYRELEAVGLQDAFGAAGSGAGFTFPVRFPQAPETEILPVVRIDYIWASEEWQPVSASVGEDIGSDHLPVVARLELIDES